MSDAARGATTFRVTADARQADQEFQKFQNSIAGLERSMDRLNRSLQRTRPVNLGNSRRQVNRLTQETNRLGGSMTRVSSAFATFTALSVALSVGNAIRSIGQLGIQAESTRERFLALSATIQEGRENYERFAEFADQRGLQFRGLVEAANQLRVVGFGGNDLIELIEQIGIIAGDSTERVERITRALGQMRAFGRVALEELNQLTEAGVPIISAIADQLDVPEGRVRGLIELGEIDFATVRAAFRDLSSESSAFFTASEAQSETAQASINRFRNALFLFSDEVNERTGPALITLIEGAASLVDFLATSEGAIVSLSVAFNALAIGGIGALLIGVTALINRNALAIGITDRFALSLSRLHGRFIIASAGAGVFRRAILLLQTAIRAAFTGPAAAITIAATVAIPLLIRRFEQLREEAQLYSDIIGALETGDIFVLEDTADIDVASGRLIELERELARVTRTGESLQRQWNAVTETVRSGNDETGAASLEQQRLAGLLSQTSTEFAEITNEIEAFKRALGEEGLPPLAVELEPVVFPDEVRNQIQAQTDALSEDILNRLNERVEAAEVRIQFAPELEQQEITRLLGQFRNLFNEVADAAGEGLFFSPTGTTITAIREYFDTFTERLEVLRQQSRAAASPLEQLNKILEDNALALITIDAAAQAGLVSQADLSEQQETSNRRALQSLIVLLNTATNLSDEARNQIQGAIDTFGALVGPQAADRDTPFADLFDPIIGELESGDLLSRIDNVFSDVEIEVANRFREYLSNIARIRGVGEDEGLVDIFAPADQDPSLIVQDQIRAETNQARLEALKDFVDEYEQESVRLVQINFNQAQSFDAVNQQQLRDYIEFGNLVGVHATDIAAQLEDSSVIDEEEAFRLHNLIEGQVDIIEEETARANAALEDGFQVRITPQITAIANAVLTLGEAFVSAGPAADNFFSIFESGSGVFDDARGGIVQTAEALAVLVSIAEQPFLAIQDAIIATSEEYQAFLQFLELSAEDQEAFLNLLPPDIAEQARSVIADFNEVFARVGTGFDADAFRLLPSAIQEVLEDAFDRYREINPTLEEIFAEARAIVEDENITIANRIREIGSFLANNLGEAVIQYGTSVANIIDLLAGGAEGLSDTFGILREVSGSLGEFLGVGRERTITFVDALDRFVRGGNDVIILQERINETIGTATIGTVLNFNRLFTSADTVEGALEQAAFASIRLNASWREAGFEAGNFRGELEELNEALNITELGLEDGALALASLAQAGGNLAGIIAPGVGLLAESVNNVIDAAADYIAVQRVISRIPPWVRQGDIELIQQGQRELEGFSSATEFAQAALSRGFDVELPELGPLASEFQEALGSIESIRPFLESGIFDQFLAQRGFPDLFPELDITRGQQVLFLFDQIRTGAELTEEQLTALADVFPDLFDRMLSEAPQFFNDQLNTTVMIARGFIDTLNTLSQTITNNARVQIEEMRFALDDLREARREAEQEVNEQLDRETEALRDRLEAGLIPLQEYYDRIDEARSIADAERQTAAQEEIKLLNDIQQAEYEAQLNAFNINKAVSLANIAINAATAAARAFADIPFPGSVAVAAIVGGLALAQGALVLAQQPPPQPPEITALQTGGVVSRPTNALIGEGGVPEAVIPLDRYEYRERGSSDEGITVVVNNYGTVIEETQLARRIYDVTRKAQRNRRVPSRAN